MIDIKNAKEIASMKKGGKILADVLFDVVKHAKVGVSELELDQMAERGIRTRGGEPGFMKVPGYHHTICACTNDVVVHGIPSSYKLKEGDVICVDCGVYLDGLHTDMAETVGVGRITPETKNFLEIGKKALIASIAMAKPGNHIGHISKTIQDIVEKEGGYSVVRNLIGHGVGKELHEDPEVPGYLAGKIEKTPLLRPGMTVAVEVIYNMGKPGVAYKNEDGWSIVSADGSMSAVFERSIVITESGNTVLTS